jgi:hypothetical protein
VAIAELNTDRTGEVAALIAQHYERAKLMLETCTWYLTAATWAMANDQPAAVAHLDRIRALDHDLPTGAEADSLRAAARAQLLAIGLRVCADLKQLRAIFEESVEAATRVQDDRLLAQVRVLFAGCVMNGGGSCDEAADLATAAVQDARRSGELELATEIQAITNYPYLHTLRLREVLDATKTVLAQTANSPDPDAAGSMLESPRSFALLWRCLAFGVLGRTAESLAMMDQAYGLLRGRGFKETLCWAVNFRLYTLRAAGAAMGETEVEIAREAGELAEAIGG